jgi:hypothetical protein
MAAAAFLSFGWGADVHRVINTKMVLHLPASLAGFTQRVQLLADSSSVPDWRKYGSNGYTEDPNEPDHFIDIDYYPEFTTHSVSMDLDSLILLHTSDTVASVGIIPWVVVWTKDSLAAQMRRGNWEKAWSTAACLGHYAADIHQPLHVTQNYNGQLTGQKGIHSRYETGMFTAAVLDSLPVTPSSVSYISDPIAYMFDRVYQSSAYVDSVLAADISAKASAGGSTTSAAYKTFLWAKTKNLTQLQVQRATEAIANLIYTAWIDAGSPAVPSLGSTAVNAGSPEMPGGFLLKQNYPNPFNPSTVIGYQLPENSRVTLKIYDLLGREVTTLVNEVKPAGSYTAAFNAGNCASGVYYCRMIAGNFTASRKLIVMK